MDMATTQQSIHVLISHHLLRRLKSTAKQHRTSVGALIRTALDRVYGPHPVEERQAAFQRLKTRSELQMTGWKAVKKELLRRHG